jgi:orotidine-5'-phosphate decarboxylase
MTVSSEVAKVPPPVRDRLALAFDVSDLSVALPMAKLLAPYFAVAKVGLELFVAAGPAAVAALRDEGFIVFLDLKLHDIPTTVLRAATRARAIGATYLTVHGAGGEAVLTAGVAGFGEGPGGILAVTVLTSERDAPPELIAGRAALADVTGCAGFVCAASDLAVARRAAPGLLATVPGIRLAGSEKDDQARAATPRVAAAAGAGLMVVGRTVTAAADPEAAAQRVVDEVVRGSAAA